MKSNKSRINVRIQNARGITLLALAVTIVVLLILTSIGIKLALGDNGIIGEARNAKVLAEIDEEKGIVKRSSTVSLIKSKGSKVEQDSLKKALIDEAGEGRTDVSDAGDVFEILFTDSNRYYEVDKDGNVSEAQEVIKDEHAGDITKGGRCDGSEEKPYEINCIEDLVVLSNMSNGSGVQFENGTIKNVKSYDNFEGKYIILMKSLNFKSKFSYADSTRTDFGNINGDDSDGNMLITEMTTGTGFTPIGDNNGNARFCGSLDGNEKSIHNLYIERSEENSKACGFIANVQEGVLVEDLTITGEIKSGSFTGGIVGSCYGPDESCIIRNCVNKANITGYNSIGGIVGFNSGEETVVENCKNYGNITITGGTWGYTGAGGISGSGAKQIINCHNYGSISGKHRMGGIVASMSPNEGILKDCSNSGDIDSGTNNTDSGGIVGRTAGLNWKIQNCINTGKVSGCGTKGGILGNVANTGNDAMNFSIENSINTGKIESSDKNAGGIIGTLNNWTQGTKISIKNVVSFGKINGVNIGGVIAQFGMIVTDAETVAENVYYTRDPAVKIGKLTSGEAILKTESEIKSQTFVDLLNSNIGTNTDWKKWKLGGNGYPTFAD